MKYNPCTGERIVVEWPIKHCLTEEEYTILLSKADIDRLVELADEKKGEK